MNLLIPADGLVLMIGAAGSGKSTFAHQHFQPSEILSSDTCRRWITDDEGDQSATADAFEVLHLVAAKRLARGRLTVIDATNVQIRGRQPLLDLATRYHRPAVAIALPIAAPLCQARNHQRQRQVPSTVIQDQVEQLERSLQTLDQEGFHAIYILSALTDIAAIHIDRQPASQG